jgi:hypothetical protein
MHDRERDRPSQLASGNVAGVRIQSEQQLVSESGSSEMIEAIARIVGDC